MTSLTHSSRGSTKTVSSFPPGSSTSSGSSAISGLEVSMIPIISIKDLILNRNIRSVDEKIGRACVDVGFFVVIDHGVSRTLQDDLETHSRAFFELPTEKKREIHMSRAGKSWRGWFSVGEELTSSVVDEKEGIYFGSEDSSEDQRPLHGRNLYPNRELARIVPLYMDQMTRLGNTLLQSIARFLNVTTSDFSRQFRRPTTLFRMFHYPPHDPRLGSNVFGVGEHTDYGYLTILKTDDSGGLQVKISGRWRPVPYVENGLVVNLGDALEHNTQGLLRATPHRVVQRRGATRSRFSWPFFFDPDFDAEMVNVQLPPSLAAIARGRRQEEQSRWDGKDPLKYRGTYGRYLMAKVSKVFPDLAQKSKL